jgi:hypothetical protein
MSATEQSEPTEANSGVPERLFSAPYAVAALTVLGAVLRFWGLGHQGLWYDESVTSLLVQRSPGVMLGLIPHTESTPPLYYCAEWVWAHIFGTNPAGLRSMSALAGTLLIPVAYLTATKLVSRRAGVITAALTACNPFLIWYSQEARSYESLALLAGLSLMTFAYALKKPARQWLLAWGVTSALAILTHYYGIIVVIPEAVILLHHHGRRRALRVAIGLIVITCLALVPLIIAQSGTGHDGWIANSPLGIRLDQIIPQFLIGTDMPVRKLFKFVAFALALGALGMAWRWLPGRQRAGTMFAVKIALGGFVLSLLFIIGGDDTLITRNIIDLWLPAAIAVGAGLASAWHRDATAAAPPESPPESPSRAIPSLARGRARFASIAATLTLCAIGVYATAAIAHDYYFERPNWVPVTKLLGAPPAPGTTRLILIQHYAYRLPLALYMPRLTYFKHLDTASDVVEIDVIGFSAPGQPLCWWGAACNLVPSRVQRHYRIGAFAPVWRRTVRQFTVLELRSVKPESVSWAEIVRTLSSTTIHHDVILIQRSAAG